MKNFTLKTERRLTAEVLCHEKNMYVRTREVAQVLGVKQQFEFTANIRREMGAKVILNGERTKGFRCAGDTEKTTFINIIDLYKFLKYYTINHKIIQSKKEELCNEILELAISERKRSKIVCPGR